MSRKLLQLAVALAALTAIAGGANLLIFGVAGLANVGGTVLTAPSGDLGYANADQLIRAIAGVWLTLGMMFAFMVRRIEKHSVWFRFACGSIFMMGIGRLASGVATGDILIPVTMIAEFVQPAVLIYWQSRVASSAAGVR